MPNSYGEVDSEFINEYSVETHEHKYVYDYAGIDFLRQEDMGLLDFYKLLRDAFIYKYQQTREGMEYLDECWIMEQKTADRSTLREMFGK